jgi:hypothetical protein
VNSYSEIQLRLRRRYAGRQILQALQQAIQTIPGHVLEYHSSQNHFSRWLNARALFPIAQMFKYLQVEDFRNIEEMRKYIYSAISSFRSSKGRG